MIGYASGYEQKHAGSVRTIGPMTLAELTKEIIAQYERHGWELRRALLKPVSRAEINETALPAAVQIIESEIDALWFARPSQGGREAWELRLLAAQPYALFDAFEADESEPEREDARQEMENRMREHSGKPSS